MLKRIQRSWWKDEDTGRVIELVVAAGETVDVLGMSRMVSPKTSIPFVQLSESQAAYLVEKAGRP